MKPQTAQTVGLNTWAIGLILALSLAGCAPSEVSGASPVQSEPSAASSSDSPPPITPVEKNDPTPSASPGSLPKVPILGTDPASAASSDPSNGANPTQLAIPTRNVQMPILPVGVTGDGSMEIPPSSDEAGWYRFGAGIGATRGTAIIAGHVDSYVTLSRGPLANLAGSRKGDLIQVATLDGTVDYQVVSVEKTSKTRIDWPTVFTRDGSHRLVLITCGGKWDRKAGHYESNIIVTAQPVKASKGG